MDMMAVASTKAQEVKFYMNATVSTENFSGDPADLGEPQAHPTLDMPDQEYYKEYWNELKEKVSVNGYKPKKYMDTLPYETEFDKQALDVVKNYQLNNFDPVSVSVCPWISYTSLTTLFDKFYLPVLYNKSTLADAMKTINKETELLISEGKDLVGAD